MDIESVRAFCLSLPHATEDVQWGDNLVLRVGKKMFAIMSLSGGGKFCLSLRTTPENKSDLLENEAIQPAPYLARYNWVALEHFDAVSAKELKDLLRQSHRLVYESLPKRLRESLK